MTENTGCDFPTWVLSVQLHSSPASVSAASISEQEILTSATSCRSHPRLRGRRGEGGGEREERERERGRKGERER